MKMAETGKAPGEPEQMQIVVSRAPRDPVILSEAKNLAAIDDLASAQSQEYTRGTKFFASLSDAPCKFAHILRKVVGADPRVCPRRRSTNILDGQEGRHSGLPLPTYTHLQDAPLRTTKASWAIPPWHFLHFASARASESNSPGSKPGNHHRHHPFYRSVGAAVHASACGVRHRRGGHSNTKPALAYHRTHHPTRRHSHSHSRPCNRTNGRRGDRDYKARV